MKINKSICIIDDDDIYQFIVKKTIHKLNIFGEISSYLNGRDAIESFKKNIASNIELPDIILLDINLPVIDGWQFMDEFVKIQKQCKKKIAIYIVSSSIAQKDIDKSKSYKDVTGFLSKPIDPDTLIKMNQIEWDA